MADAIEPELLPPDPANPDGDGEAKSFLDHLEDLRWMLVKMAATLAVAMGICFFFAPYMLKVFTYPLSQVVPDTTPFLRTQDVTGGFMLAIKLSLYSGLTLAFPLLLHFFGQFVLPALTPREKKLVAPVIVGGFGLFLAGVALAYFWVVPQGLKFFLNFNQELGIRSDWLIDKYIAFVTHMVLAFGLCFELPLVVLALAKLGIVTHEFLRQKRRYAVVIIFILAAFLTPTPDIINQCLLAVPMTALYEACVWIAWWMERKKRS